MTTKLATVPEIDLAENVDTLVGPKPPSIGESAANLFDEDSFAATQVVAEPVFDKSLVIEGPAPVANVDVNDVAGAFDVSMTFDRSGATATVELPHLRGVKIPASKHDMSATWIVPAPDANVIAAASLAPKSGPNLVSTGSERVQKLDADEPKKV